MEKLLVILSRFPFPLEKGDKLRAFHQIRILSQYFDIHLVTTNRTPITLEQKEALSPYCKSIHTFQVSKIQFIKNLFRFAISGKPLQLSFFYTPEMSGFIQGLVQQNQIDKSYFQLIRTACYAEQLKTHNYLDYMDTLSTGVFRQAKHQKGIKKWFYLLEAKRLAKYEQSVFSLFKKKFIISNQDRELFQFKEKSQIEISPNGVSPIFLEEIQQKTNADIVFAGNMAYPPNVEAAKYIVNEILPLSGNVKSIIAGANPTNDIQSLASDHVHISGWVEDIRTAYKSASIFVAPLFIGTGLQNKLLEAMALGIPCVTTSLCNNALKAKSGEEILIANSPQEFADCIQQLLTDEQLRSRIIHNAKAFILQNYNWEEIGHQLAISIQE